MSVPVPPLPGAPLLTRRLELRAVEESDLRELTEIHTDPRAFLRDRTAPLDDAGQMRRVLADWIWSARAHGIGYAGIRLRGRDAPLLGVAGLTRRRTGPRATLSAYYRLRPEAVGRGYAHEAMEALLDAAARALPGETAAVVTDEGNAPSLALASRLGFERDDEAGAAEPAGLVALTRILAPAAEDPR